MGEKFGEFGELSVIRQTKTIQIFTYNYYLMAESIHSPNFASPNAHNSEIHQTFSPPNFPAIWYDMFVDSSKVPGVCSKERLRHTYYDKKQIYINTR